MDAPDHSSRRWLTANTVLLALSSLFGDVSTEMLYPVLPTFLTSLGASGSIIGLIDGVAQATQNITQGASGWLADRLQKPKPIALVGFFLAAISKPLMGLAPAWPGVFGARVLDRLGAGTRSAPRDALIAGSVTEQDRGKAFGLEGAGDNLGAFLGPLITVLLLGVFALQLRWIFYLALIPGLLAFLMVLLVRPQPVKVAAKTRLDFNLRQLPVAYWRYVGVVGLFCLGNSSNAFLILETQSAGASLDLTILIYAGYNLVAALISYPAGWLSDRFGRKRMLLLAFFVFLVAYLGFALSRDLPVIALLFAVYGLYQGMFRAVGKAFAADLVPGHLRASGIGWFSTTVGLVQLVASVVAGLLWDRVGHQAVFAFGALFALAGILALAVFISAGRPQAPAAS
ncbi:MAG: MFS transporter [Devosia sp.]|nr:MFS transporter [Devosia sp.]